LERVEIGFIPIEYREDDNLSSNKIQIFGKKYMA